MNWLRRRARQSRQTHPSEFAPALLVIHPRNVYLPNVSESVRKGQHSGSGPCDRGTSPDVKLTPN